MTAVTVIMLFAAVSGMSQAAVLDAKNPSASVSSKLEVAENLKMAEQHFIKDVDEEEEVQDYDEHVAAEAVTNSTSGWSEIKCGSSGQSGWCQAWGSDWDLCKSTYKDTSTACASAQYNGYVQCTELAARELCEGDSYCWGYTKKGDDQFKFKGPLWGVKAHGYYECWKKADNTFTNLKCPSSYNGWCMPTGTHFDLCTATSTSPACTSTINCALSGGGYVSGTCTDSDAQTACRDDNFCLGYTKRTKFGQVCYKYKGGPGFDVDASSTHNAYSCWKK